VGTIATAVTPPNAIVVAQIAYTERDKNAEGTRNIRKQKGQTAQSTESKANVKSKEWQRYKGKIDRSSKDLTKILARQDNESEKEKSIMALAKSQKSLKAWTKQKWRTKSGKPSTQGPKATGERYLPSAAIKALSPGEYAATTAAKRKGKAQGKQFVAQPKNIKKKVKRFRKVK